MSQSLWPQLRLTADTEEELVEKYRKIYLDTYVYNEQGEQRVFEDWRGEKMIFAKEAFDHAFSKAKNYREGLGYHDGGFAKERLRRILWIAEVIRGSAGTIERYSQLVSDSRGGRQKKRRTYVVVDECYIVVFDDPRKDGEPYRFVTAIPSHKEYIRKEIKAKAFLQETKKS